VEEIPTENPVERNAAASAFSRQPAIISETLNAGGRPLKAIFTGIAHELTFRVNFCEKMRIELCSWHERKNHSHP
jgi:hypothetical protein